MSAVDLLSEWFECEQLIAPMAVSGIIGTFLGIRSPGTAYVLLHHAFGEVNGKRGAWGHAMGGMGAISGALAQAFQAHGGEIRTEAGVEQIIVNNGTAEGVALDLAHLQA